MPKFIITLTMQWGYHQSEPRNPRVLGWAIAINGLTPGHCDYLRSSATTLHGRPMVETVNGAVVDLMISPRENPWLNFRNGARSNKPPMGRVTEMLNALGYIGYEVASSQIVSCNEGNSDFFGVWTLQMDKP